MFFGDGDAEDLFLFWVSFDIESRVDSTVVGLFFKDIVSLSVQDLKQRIKS